MAQIRLETKVDKMCEQMNSFGSALAFMVQTQCQFTPAVAKKGKSSATIVEQVQQTGEEIKKRLMHHHINLVHAPPQKAQKSSAIEACPASPSYSPPSPSYSPTSPSHPNSSGN